MLQIIFMLADVNVFQMVNSLIVNHLDHYLDGYYEVARDSLKSLNIVLCIYKSISL